MFREYRLLRYISKHPKVKDSDLPRRFSDMVGYLNEVSQGTDLDYVYRKEDSPGVWCSTISVKGQAHVSHTGLTVLFGTLGASLSLVAAVAAVVAIFV